MGSQPRVGERLTLASNRVEGAALPELYISILNSLIKGKIRDNKNDQTEDFTSNMRSTKKSEFLVIAANWNCGVVRLAS